MDPKRSYREQNEGDDRGKEADVQARGAIRRIDRPNEPNQIATTSEQRNYHGDPTSPSKVIDPSTDECRHGDSNPDQQQRPREDDD